jgi:hypothetical protein
MRIETLLPQEIDQSRVAAAELSGPEDSNGSDGYDVLDRRVGPRCQRTWPS